MLIRASSVVLFALALSASTALADEVVLKDGAVLTGEARTVGDRVEVKLDIGIVAFDKDEVKEIRESNSALGELNARRAKLSADDVSGWRALAEWAESHELATQARGLWRHVLELSPGDPRAHERLGDHLHEGRWLDEDEYMRAKGFVHYLGEWLTPEQAQQREAEALARRELRAKAAVRPPVVEPVVDRPRDEDTDDDDNYLGWGPWFDVPAFYAPQNPQPTRTPPRIVVSRGLRSQVVQKPGAGARSSGGYIPARPLAR